MKRIFLLNGNPDPSPERFCAALATAYAAGAVRVGHEVRRFDLGKLDFPVLRSAAESRQSPVTDDVARVQDAIRWADHIVVIHPLWLYGQPALLRALFEQVFRYNFVHAQSGHKKKKALKGKTARIIVTMSASVFSFRWKKGAYCVRALETGLFGYAAVHPVRHTLIGSIQRISDSKRQRWLKKVETIGAGSST